MSETPRRDENRTHRHHDGAADLARAYLVRADGTAKKPDAYLVPIFDRYDISTPERFVNASGSQNVLVNKQLKAVAKRVEAAGTVMPAKLTFHIARHTWADLARKSGRDVYETSASRAPSALSASTTSEHFIEATSLKRMPAA